MIIGIVKVFVPAILAFIVGILITPALSAFLYKHKMWKKKAGKVDLSGNEATEFNKLHKEREVNTPRMGGIIIWASAIITMFFIWLIAHFSPSGLFGKIDFLSRSQTWIPFATLVLGGIVGFFDDLFEVSEKQSLAAPGGMSLNKRLTIVAIIAFLCASWFYWKLGISSIGLPFDLPNVQIGIFFIPLFILVTLGIYAGGVIDGIDGLAGGVFGTIFAAYAGIAFHQHQIDLAAFCALVVGAILAFLWFNIPPARFYMTETGSMGLTITLAVVAFMTDTLGDGHGLIVLPIIALPLVLTVLSNVIQVGSKKLRNGKKVFRVAPLHHHFEALGWPASKVTMRFWIIGVVCAVLGLTIALIG